MSHDSDNAFPEREVDIKKSVFLIAGQWKLVLACMGISLCVAIAFAMTRKPVFISTSKFITKSRSNQDNSAMSSLAQMTGFSFPAKQDQDPFSHLEEMIKNLEVMEKVAARKWAYGKDSLMLAQIWKLEPDSSEPDWQFRFHRKLIDRIRNKTLNITEQDGLRVLTVSAGDPKLAYEINRYLLDLMNDYMMNNVKSQAKENVGFIEDRLRETQEELTGNEDALSHFQKRNLDLSSPPITMEYKRLARKVAVSEEVFLQLRKQEELARIDEKKEQPLIILVKKPEIPLDRAKPNRKLIVLAGAFFGVAFGLIAAFSRVLFLTI